MAPGIHVCVIEIGLCFGLTVPESGMEGYFERVWTTSRSPAECAQRQYCCIVIVIVNLALGINYFLFALSEVLEDFLPF